MKGTNVKIANIFLLVRDKHVVTKHLWEVDIGLSESLKNLTPDDLDGVISIQGHESENRAWRLNGCSYAHGVLQKCSPLLT